MYEYLSVCVHAFLEEARKHQGPRNWGYKGLWAAMRVLGTEPGSSPKAASGCSSPLSISPARVLLEFFSRLPTLVIVFFILVSYYRGLLFIYSHLLCYDFMGTRSSSWGSFHWLPQKMCCSGRRRPGLRWDLTTRLFGFLLFCIIFYYVSLKLPQFTSCS